MRDAGLIVFRRNDVDIVGQRLCDALEQIEAGRMDAVIVGDQNAHGL